MNINESLTIKEHYYEDNGGVIIKPAIDPERPDDITGYILSASDEAGRLYFTTNKVPFIPTKNDTLVTLVLSESEVTNNAQAGKILLNIADFAAGANFALTVNNTLCFSSSLVMVQIYRPTVSNVEVQANIAQINAGNFVVNITNVGTVTTGGEVFGLEFWIA